MITVVGVPVEEALADIGMKDINIVIHMDFYGEASWVKYLGELWKTHIVDQLLDCITNP